MDLEAASGWVLVSPIPTFKCEKNSKPNPTPVKTNFFHQNCARVQMGTHRFRLVAEPICSPFSFLIISFLFCNARRNQTASSSSHIAMSIFKNSIAILTKKKLNCYLLVQDCPSIIIFSH